MSEQWILQFLFGNVTK